jgi:PKD domain
MAAGTGEAARSARMAVLVLLLLVLLIGALPLTGDLSISSRPAAAAAPLAVVPPTIASHPSHPLPPGAAPWCPAIVGCDYTVFGAADYTIAPPFPNPYNGLITPFPLDNPNPSTGYFHDEVHATFSSPVAGSGERMTLPFILPNNTCECVAGSYADFSVGLVLDGDTTSIDNQTYLDVYFSPLTDGTGYAVSAAVWALYNNNSAHPCQAIHLTWNGNNSCEDSILTGGPNGDLLGESVLGGSVVNVTFIGTYQSVNGIDIFVNQSSTSTDYTLNVTQSNVGYPLYPAYPSACIDSCVLNWSSLFGVAFSADLCDAGGCDSYIETDLNESAPATILPPLYYTGGAYTGQYSGLSTQSLSGACFSSTPGTICPSNPSNVPAYPIFTFNGTALNLGVVEPWTTETFGGASTEFDLTGYPRDWTPEWITPVTNDSLGGYIATGSPVTVDAQVQALGTTASVTLNYSLPDGTGANESMTLVNGTMGSSQHGTAGDAWYTATIPGTGGNGKILYRVFTEDYAGVTIARPFVGIGAFTVKRGPIPTFVINITISNPTCGSVDLNHTAYTNGTAAFLEPGTYPISAQVCYPYVFGSWASSGSLMLPTTASGAITVSGNGTIEGVWAYVRPFDTVTVGLVGCGTLYLNGTAYTANNSVLLLDRENYTIGQSACGGSVFAGWTVSSESIMDVLGTNLYLQGNGTLTANFVSASTAFKVEFLTEPSVCPGGGVLFRGVGYTNAEEIDLTGGVPYPFHQLPCTGFGFEEFQETSGITIASGTITATSDGIVTEVNYALTLVTIVTDPAHCGSVLFDNVSYTNGGVTNVTNNSVNSAYATACAGYYFTGFEPSGGLTVLGNQITVNGSGDLVASFFRGTPQTFVAFLTNPGGCGSILFNGVDYTNGEYTDVAPNTPWTLVANPCAGRGFVSWGSSGGITITGNTANVGVVGGSIIANFNPLEPLKLYTTPSNCGAIDLAGQLYPSGSTASLPTFVTVPVEGIPCPGYGFSLWHNTTDAILNGNELTLEGAGYLTAVFTPLSYNLSFFVSPPTCGGLGFGGVEYFNNSSTVVLGGTYPIDPDPCTGDTVLGWNVTGNVTVLDDNVTVSGNGSVLVEYGPAPLAVTLSAPAGTSSYAGQGIEFEATVAVPVPPYDYNYTWNFGDGSTANTPANFTSHTYAQPGVYKVEVKVVDPYGRVATANATVTIVAATGVQGITLTLPAVGLLVGVLVVVLVVLLLARRRPPSPEAAPESGVPPTATPLSFDRDSDTKAQEPSTVSSEPSEGASQAN